MDGHVRFRQVAGFVSACIIMTVMGLVQGARTDVHAATVYSYTDDRGNPVYTDDWQKVPEKYRTKVQRFEQMSEQQSVGGKVKDFGSKLRSFRISAGGLSEEQTTVLNYAGGAAIGLLAVMYLFKKSPMIRLLALGLLIVLGLGTPVLIYTSEGGALNIMKEKAVANGQAQQDRLKQAP